MGGIAGFFAMGGYGEFVWSAYGVALVVLAGLSAHSWRRYRQSVLALQRLQQSRRSNR